MVFSCFRGKNIRVPIAIGIVAKRFKDSKDSKIQEFNSAKAGIGFKKYSVAFCVSVFWWRQNIRVPIAIGIVAKKIQKFKKLASLSSPDSPDRYRDRDRFKDSKDSRPLARVMFRVSSGCLQKSFHINIVQLPGMLFVVNDFFLLQHPERGIHR